MLYWYAYFILVVTLHASDAAKQYIIFGPVRPCMCVCVSVLRLWSYDNTSLYKCVYYYYIISSSIRVISETPLNRNRRKLLQIGA